MHSLELFNATVKGAGNDLKSAAESAPGNRRTARDRPSPFTAGNSDFEEHLNDFTAFCTASMFLAAPGSVENLPPKGTGVAPDSAAAASQAASVAQANAPAWNGQATAGIALPQIATDKSEPASATSETCGATACQTAAIPTTGEASAIHKMAGSAPEVPVDPPMSATSTTECPTGIDVGTMSGEPGAVGFGPATGTTPGRTIADRTAEPPVMNPAGAAGLPGQPAVPAESAPASVPEPSIHELTTANRDSEAGGLAGHGEISGADLKVAHDSFPGDFFERGGESRDGNHKSPEGNEAPFADRMGVESAASATLDNAHRLNRAPGVPITEQVLNEIATHVELSHRDGKIDFRLRLDPPGLGTVHVQLTAAGDSISARLLVEDRGAQQLLEGQLHTLRESLADLGVALDHLGVAADDRGSRGAWQWQRPEPPSPAGGTVAPKAAKRPAVAGSRPAVGAIDVVG